MNMSRQGVETRIYVTVYDQPHIWSIYWPIYSRSLCFTRYFHNKYKVFWTYHFVYN